VFLTFEGLDGAGKSTQVEKLKKYLETKGRTVSVFREPGGTDLGERVREVLLYGDDILPWTEASLFAAARAELIGRLVWPALEAGDVVILDRYIDSTLVYQGKARGLPFEELMRWNMNAVSGLMPDRTFVLTLPAEDATARLGHQLRLFKLDESGVGPPDRLEREEYSFRRAVDEGYRSLAREFPGRVVEIDASLTRAQVAKLIRIAVESALQSERPATHRALTLAS
jgi:dTMP kinase